MTSPRRFLRLASLCLVLTATVTAPSTICGQTPPEPKLQVLFLGDDGHHQPKPRFEQLQPVLAARGIALQYTDKLSDLNSDHLAKFDALVVYANIDVIEPAQAQAVLDYVADGGGYVPLHCASYCFRNSPELVALTGAQFLRHGTGVFRTEQAEAEHPILRGFGGFESWDETYVHHQHNEQDRTVLEYRAEGGQREPWTWIRTHGKGRVFYTAWGHDERTWGNAGFQNLVERGIRWAAGTDVAVVPDYLADLPPFTLAMQPPRKDVQPFEYLDVGAKIPNYTPGEKWGEQGKPLNLMQKPLPPAESLKHLVVPVGFHVELFASEPEIGGKPISMAWDERGRLWIAETYDYPNELQPRGQGRDRIRICEDTDHDGRADKFTVFAEKLSIPTGIAFHQGGVIVQAGTETLYLKDLDGDDRADETQVLISGWAMGDTHGGVSNYQYGLDNWLWAMQGYNNSRPVVQGKQQEAFRMGFFRFRPDGSRLEFIRSTNNNTWGLGISEEGIIFGSTANHNPSVYMPIPNRYYEKVRGWTTSLMLDTIADTYLFKPITDKIRQVDQFGGYTAGAGHALYTARAYPQAFWNRTAFVNGPTGHLTGTFVLSRDGADFHSTSPFNLLASDDEWTAPIMAEVGPDGQVWIIDWYNYIVQHNPTPIGFTSGKGNAYETDLRDKKHGRIYRVVYDAAPAYEPLSLAGASGDKLVSTLRHPTMLWRKHAQRLLVERQDRSVVPQLLELIADPTLDPIGLNVGAIHALWTLHGLGVLDGTQPAAAAGVYAALAHPSPGVRRNAVQVLPATAESVARIVEQGLLQDADAQVRLAALLALADLPPTPAGGAALVQVWQDPRTTADRWLRDAATSASAHNSVTFLSSLASLREPAAALVETTRIVAEHYARGDEAGPEAVLLVREADPAVVDAFIRGLARGWPKERQVQLTADLDQALEELLPKLPAGSRGGLVRLAANWGSERLEKYAAEIYDELMDQIENDELPDARRVAAAGEFAAFASDDEAAAGRLLQLLSPRLPPTVATGLLRALSQVEAPGVGALVVEQLPSLTPELRATALAVLLSRSEWTASLLEGLEAGQVPLSDLSLDQKQALGAHPNPSLRRRARTLLERGGALPSADRLAVLTEWLPVTEHKGDVMAGQALFKKHCAKCHMHSGEGNRIGPDLTGMAVHPKHEMLTNILDPNRSVEGNYRVYTVVTADGLVLTGLLASESKTTLELYDAEGNKKTVLRDDVEQILGSTKSLMPEGFEKQVTRQEMTDLLEFLAARGKYVPLSLAKVATITSVRGMFYSKDAEVERLIFPSWEPKEFRGVPFQLIDPQDGRVPNAVLLHGPLGDLTRTMPRQVELPCNMPVRAIHMLSGVSGWGFPYGPKGSVSLIVRLHYADGQTEDHELINGEHFADYIRRVDVPQSEFAFALRGQQLRYLNVVPKRTEPIAKLELVKGPDTTAPVVMAVTLESLP